MTRDERQEQCRKNWILNKCKGTLVCPTGFGKTRTAINCLNSVIKKYPSFRILVIVPSEALKNQWQSILITNMLSFNSQVCIINTAIKHDWNVDILVLDEAHRYCSEEYSTIFTKVKYKMILGLTATLERLDGKHSILEKYSPVVDKVSLTEALTNGWVSTYKEYQVIIDVDDIDTYLKWDNEFTRHFEFFNFNFKLLMALVGPQGFKRRIEYRDLICQDESQKSEVLKAITIHATAAMKALQNRKKFINNHPKKIEIAKKIIAARSNSKIITFSNNVKMAESIGGDVYTGKVSKKKGNDLIDKFNNSEFGLLNSCHRLNEGADIKGLSVAIILGLDTSKIKSTQRLGRAIRLESDKRAEIFNIIINDTAETSWFTNSHSDKQYITIDEDGLDAVLNYKEPKPYRRKITKNLFRF